MQSLKIKIKMNYGGHSVNNSGIVNLNLSCSYEELTNVIQLFQLINTDVTLLIKQEGKTNKLGVFTIKNISVNNNGESKIKLSSLVDAVNLSYISDIIDKELVKVCFASEIEVEEEENEVRGEEE